MDIDVPLAPLPEGPIESGGSSSNIPWGTIVVLLVASAIFLLQWTGAPSTCLSTSETSTCGAEDIVTNYPGISLTLLPFLHGNALHFLSNITMILVLGIAFERRGPALAFIGLFVLAAYVSIYADISFAALAGTGGLAIGTSGATRAVSGFLVVQYLPMAGEWSALASVGDGFLSSYSFDVFAIVVGLVALYATSVSLGQYLGLMQVAPETAYIAHLVGTVIGVVTGGVYRLQR